MVVWVQDGDTRVTLPSRAAGKIALPPMPLRQRAQRTIVLATAGLAKIDVTEVYHKVICIITAGVAAAPRTCFLYGPVLFVIGLRYNGGDVVRSLHSVYIKISQQMGTVRQSWSLHSLKCTQSYLLILPRSVECRVARSVIGLIREINFITTLYPSARRVPGS